MNEDFEPKTGETSTSAYTAPASEPKKKEKKRISAFAIIALALCFSILGGAAGSIGAGLVSDRLRPNRAVTEVSPAPEATQPAPEETAESNPETSAAKEPDPTAAATHSPTAQPASVPEKAVETMAGAGERKLMSAADVYEANVNSTVGITTSITSTNYWGYQSSAAASGSGFIYSADGYILTNYHVIEDSSSITVTTYDGTAYKAEVVGYDQDNDVAVLKVDATDLQPVTLGSSDQLRVGDDVLAIGNPLGELTFSLTKGCVSALNREVTLSAGTTMDLIQTDTAINSGNSGGALFNMYGEVVGITNAKLSSQGFSSSASIDNIGFAIPIDSVKGLVNSIIEHGYIVKPYLGVSMSTVSSEMQSYGFPQGAAVRVVNEGSPAAEAGLQVNDIITAVNGTPVTTSSQLKRIVSRSTPGDTLALTVYRQNAGEVEISVVVGERQQDAEPQAQPTQQPNSQQWGGGQNEFPFDFPFGGFFGNVG